MCLQLSKRSQPLYSACDGVSGQAHALQDCAQMGMVALTQDGRPALQALLKQELLLALQGYAGALFEVQTSSGPQARTNLAEELSWLAPSDRCVRLL